MKEINSHLLYIGADDAELDLFESQYPLPEGMAYNSYLIRADKIAVMDTVDARKGEEWKAKLNEALGGRESDYLVVHHLEPDHSALIAELAGKYKEMKIVASAKAISMLPQFFDEETFEGRTIAVKDGDSIDLGGLRLQFFLAPMVHWPEVAISYLVEDKIIFSADAFGTFGTLESSGFYGDEVPDWEKEARRYYFNICGKYGAQVQAMLKKCCALDVGMICPLHGPILRKEISKYRDFYNNWSLYEAESQGVLVAYASIHGGTKAVAEHFAEILKSKGVSEVSLYDLARGSQSEAVSEAFRHEKLVLAAASYDSGLFPPAFEFIHHLQDKAWQKRRVGLIENGSWAPSAGRVMREMFAGMKGIDIAEPLVTIRSRMKASDLPALEALADSIQQ